MGKKKRKKSFRPSAMKLKLPLDIHQRMNERRKITEQAFQDSCNRVRVVLTRFHPGDVLAALNISDLWQPNRASQVKHQLAFSLLVSLPADSFTSDRMVTYEDFTGFCSALIEAFRDFPALEVYVPEADWGDVKVLLGEEQVSILYGGLVQGIIDYIEAFRICHGNGTQAIVDLEHSIRLQGELLQQVPRNGDDGDDDLSPGYIEVPSQSFWEAVKSALTQLPTVERIRAEYVVELGQHLSWTGASGFSDAVMTGTTLPWLAVRIEGEPYAMSLRNATSVVIDVWAKASPDEPLRVAERFGSYLAKRMEGRSCWTGPLHICSRRERVPLPIAGVLVDDMLRLFLIVLVPPGQLERAGKAVRAMRRVMQDPDWGLQVIGVSEGFQFRDSRGMVPGPTTVEIILVSTEVTTGYLATKAPSSSARVMSLIDACMIFDAIESVNELAQFWSYADDLHKDSSTLFNDLSNLFASFRDSDGQIVEGAVIPNYLILDPYWGACWRYGQLKTFWQCAPLFFPDESSAWRTHEVDGVSSLTRVTAKNARKLAWSSVIGGCTLHFILDVEAVGLEPKDGQLLKLFVHCTADSIARRASIISPVLKLPFRRVNLRCFSAPDLLASTANEQSQKAVARPLITAWDEESGNDLHSYQARLTVNLAKLVEDLKDARDSRFEVSCALSVVEGLFAAQGGLMPPELREALEATADLQPRFIVDSRERVVDVPDFCQPQVPRSEDYKVARRDLAILLKTQGVIPGTYRLEAAKALINSARTAYRDRIHERIRELDRESLLRYGVEQYDALISSYDRDVSKAKLSLRHEVDYDREKSLAKAHKDFVRHSKNYRYLLESALVLASPQALAACVETVHSILAMVDWLFVLYEASDVLHNGIDVGGLRVDDQYVPEVFYSRSRDEQEEIFRQEMAALRLGINVAEEDRVTATLVMKGNTASLDEAFKKDLGFSYSHMLQVLSVLIRWVSAGGTQSPALGYVSNRKTIAERAVVAYPDLPEETALLVIKFLLLDPDQIRRLIGKDDVEGDVPVWEHAKRGSRHAIRPLIELPDGHVLWGAAAVERAQRIWMGAISAGYLPADYDWPTVQSEVSKLKKELEDSLEDRAHEVCARAMRYIEKGIDFRKRFPKHKFPDVGDFDVLAYQPEENLWLTVECKYNKPAFCLKDSRRLRDEIFGKDQKKSGQMLKIERRRDFLTQNAEELRNLLGWPAPAGKPFSLMELYVCKDIHFWLRFPPYEVPTHFVQIDTLDAWLRSHITPCGIVDDDEGLSEGCPV